MLICVFGFLSSSEPTSQLHAAQKLMDKAALVMVKLGFSDSEYSSQAVLL